MLPRFEWQKQKRLPLARPGLKTFGKKRKLRNGQIQMLAFAYIVLLVNYFMACTEPDDEIQQNRAAGKKQGGSSREGE
jgi:hypothetical protein